MAGMENNMLFPGKIAVITSSLMRNNETFHSAKHLIMKYGPEKIIHDTWPENFRVEKARMIHMAEKLAGDSEVRGLIINQALPGTNDAVARLRELRDDIFVVYCTVVHEAVPEASALANLILTNDELGMGRELVDQAKKQGAKTLIHYSLTRHMAIRLYSDRYSLIEQECEKEGLQLVGVIALDPVDDHDAARQFILEDVPRMVALYGEDTAFFCTNCTLQAPLIRAVIDNHAIYPLPCCPSPYHGFPEAMGIDTGEDLADLTYVVTEACRIAAEKNMTDRLSTWPVSTSMMYTSTGAEYAIKWINDEVPKTSIDNDVLRNCMKAYVKDVVGEESNVYMKSYSENGAAYENFKLILMSYLDF